MAFDLSTLSLVLVLLGLVQLGAGFFATRSIIRDLPARRAKWTVLAVLIALFALGYAGFAFWVARTATSPIELLIAAVFAGGGTFVLVVTRLSRDSINEVNRLAVSLDRERERIDDAHRRLQTVFDNAAEGIVTIDHAGRVASCNRAGAELLGLASDTVIGRTVESLVECLDRDNAATTEQKGWPAMTSLVGRELEISGLHASGRRVALSIRLSRMQSDGREAFIAILGDIEERKQLLDRLRHAAERDGATNLYNRRYFHDRLQKALAVLPDGEALSVLYIDLDHFKAVNDRFGHAAGDAVLVDVAELLLAKLPETAVVARIGGDEFTALIPRHEIAQAAEHAETVRRALEHYRFGADGQHIDVGSSIGLASVATSGRDRDRLLAHADLACRIAKRGGRNRVHVFDARDAIARGRKPSTRGAA